MKRLTIIGTTPNGDGVVLSDDKGAKFLVANDPRLGAVTEHDLSRQLEMALQTFSPREIQARVRGGASAEVIAAETGWPLDKVLRYAEPLLAERAYIAQVAQGVEVRRSGGGATLLEAAYASLDAEPDADAIVWDAWRREDGRWIVSATYGDRDGAHTAQWTYDHVGRNLHPLDDDARSLMGARPMALSDDDMDGIADALGLIAEPAPEPEFESRPRLMAVPDADEGDDEGGDDSADGPVGNPAAHETVAIPHPSAAQPPAPVEEAPAQDTPKPKPAPRKPKARKGRASVPSWDEILFGATKQEE